MNYRLHIRSFFILFTASIISLQAQVVYKFQDSFSERPKSYPIHAYDVLWKKELEVRQYIKDHPEALQRKSFQKAEAYAVGSKKSWYADDFRETAPSPRYAVATTCKAVGTNCYVFVEDASWTNGRVTQAVVDSVKLYFDSKTPANPSKGIYQSDVDAFGNPPNVDADPKIVILLLDIKDDYVGSGGYVEGYFYSFNEIPKTEPGYSQSNYAEIFFIDTNPLNLNTEEGIYSGMSTLAHEFQHMIHWNYDTYEWTFINEGCSTLAEVNCGFPIYSPSLYANEPNHYLFGWRPNDDSGVLNDYSRAARFFVYLRDQAGIGVLKNIVASTYTAIDGINAGLQASGSDLRFADILQNWFIANMLDDRTVDTKYGYMYPNLPKPSERTCYNPNIALTTDSVERYAVRYIGFKNGSQLKATFTVNNPALLVKAIEIGPSGNRVLDVTNGVEFSEPLYGSTYTEIHFAIMNTSTTNYYGFTYHASGIGQAIELGYDFTEPSFASFGLKDKDSMCVVFDAVQDGRLDSIRVALRRDTYITGGIWKYTGQTRPTPLGQNLTTFTIKGLSTPSSNPYPTPWPNWVTVDLRSQNISTNSPFAVGFIIDGTYPDDANVNRVMIKTAPIGNGRNSLSYDQNGSSGAQWYFYVTSEAGDSAYYYLIRAYVNFKTNGVRNTVELNPMSFNLSQNFPNPFNPSTSIQFTLPSRMYTTLKVYDMLGREVATLIDGFQESGSHDVKFDAAHLPSGVYLYRISTDTFTETKKLVLLK
jgi:hypothetical protein